MKVFITLLLSFFTFYVNAQDIIVFDQATNEPISGVVAYNKSKSKSVMSDFDGKISLAGFDTNETIIFQHLSYFNFKTEKNKIKNVVYLEPKSQDLDEIVISASKFEHNEALTKMGRSIPEPPNKEQDDNE